MCATLRTLEWERANSLKIRTDVAANRIDLALIACGPGAGEAKALNELAARLVKWQRYDPFPWESKRRAFFS
jgi:hypothetical protein